MLNVRPGKQVTYPYIMAKVRIQARSADVDDAEAEHAPPPKHNRPHHKAGHHVGALTVLARVWRRKGFLGWYQVRPSRGRVIRARARRRAFADSPRRRAWARS